MLAKATKIDELKLDNEESRVLAGAIQNVAQHYDISPDPKVVAWIGLIGVVATLYAPRFAAVKLRKASKQSGGRPQEEAKAEEAAGLAMVRPFTMNA